MKERNMMKQAAIRTANNQRMIIMNEVCEKFSAPRFRASFTKLFRASFTKNGVGVPRAKRHFRWVAGVVTRF